MQIEGSAALVVGGASGLGEATVRELHGRGAVVTIADVNAEKGRRARIGARSRVRRVRRAGGGARCEAAVEQAASAEGGLRVAVCCAGTGWAQKVAGSKGPHPLLPFETIISINLIGTFNVLRHAGAAMIANEPLEDGERGVCVNTASIAAFDGQVGQIAYSASKGGVVGDDAAGGARPRAVRHPRQHDRPGPVRHAAARGAARGGAPEARRRSPVSRSVSDGPPSTRSSPASSSRTGCSTARRSVSTARCGCRLAESLLPQRQASRAAAPSVSSRSAKRLEPQRQASRAAALRASCRSDKCLEPQR